MSWIEKHPFSMAGISSIIVFLFGVMFHYIQIRPHNWSGFLLWIPVYCVAPFIVSTISYLSEEEKTE